MGLFWSAVHPLLLLFLYTFVFSIAIRIPLPPEEGTPYFAFFLASGLFPWIGFQEAVGRSATAIMDHAHLIKRAAFPSEVLPVYLVVSGFFHQVIALAILILVMVVLGQPVSYTALGLAGVFLLQLVWTCGLAWFVAAATVFFRDLQQLVSVGLTLWFFLTPIAYPASIMPPEAAWILSVNPIHHLMESYRSLLLRGGWPSWEGTLFFGAAAAAAFVAGGWFFQRVKHEFADLV
jgi:ABC-type polysaccharide/polyol phosphate export permease